MKIPPFIALALACLAAHAVAASDLTLVAAHQPKSIIVLPAEPSPVAKASAKLMTDIVAQMSGANLPTIKEAGLGGVAITNGRIEAKGQSPDCVYLLIGESALAQKLGASSEGLGAGGILLKTFPNALVLLGADAKTPDDPQGTRYAVTTFLDEVLGCRYLWPGELGLAVPQRDTVKVPALDRQYTPAIRERHIRSNDYGERIQIGLDGLKLDKDAWARTHKIAGPNWFDWQRMGGTLGIKASDGSIIPAEAWARFLKEHPEWFAMQVDGSRVPAPGEERLRLCKSNPALIDAIVQEKLKELRANPGQKCVSLVTHDGGRTGFCQCPACKALDAQEGRPTEIWTYNHAANRVDKFQYVSLSDRMFWFNNQIAERVAKEFPNVLFCGSAYSCYTAPPLHIKLHPHVVLRYAGMDYNSDAARREGLEEWDGWSKAASMVQYRPNFLLAGRCEGTPAIYVHKLAADIRHMASTGLVGTDFDACMNSWSTQGLTYYVLAKLLWNPNLDVDAEIESYCRAGFGKGWKDVESYYAHLEQLMNETAAVNHAPGPDTPDGLILDPYTPEVLAQLRANLDAASHATADDAPAHQRVAFLRRGFDFLEVQAAARSLLRRVADLNAEEKVAARQLLDRRWVMMRTLFAEEPYAVNVAALVQAEARRFRHFDWTGPSAAAQAAVAGAGTK